MNAFKGTAKNTNYIKLVSVFYFQIKPVIGDIRIKDLKKEDIERVAEKRSVGVVRDCHVLLKKMFRYYCEVKGLKASLLDGVKRPEPSTAQPVKKRYTNAEIREWTPLFSSGKSLQYCATFY